MELKDINSTQNGFSVSKVDFLKNLTVESAFANLLKSASSQEVADFSSQVKESKEKSFQEVKNGNTKSEKVVADKKEKTVEVKEVKSDKGKAHKSDKSCDSNEKVSSDDKKDVKNAKEKTAKDTANMVNKVNNNEKAVSESDTKEESMLAFVYGAQSPDDLPVDDIVLASDTALVEVKEDILLFPAGSVSSVDADVETPVITNSTPVIKDVVPNSGKAVENGAVKFAEVLNEDVELPLIEEFKAVISENVKIKENTEAVNSGKVNTLVNSEVAEQASKISEILGSDKKLNISVDVKEEKFAYKDVVSNKMDLLKAVDAAVEAISVESGEMQAVMEDSSSNVVSEISQVNAVAGDDAISLPVTPTVSGQNISAKDAEVKVSPVSVKEDLSVSSISTAQAYKASDLKTEATIANDEKTTFKDVYKGLGKEAVEQVKVNITKSAVKGVDKIAIQLKPEDLGSVEVKLKIGKDGKLDAQIMSSRPETLEALQKDASSLEKAFNDAGFKTDDGSLSFSLKDGSEQNSREQLKNFIGDVLEKDTELAIQEHYWNNSSGVNIRV